MQEFFNYIFTQIYNLLYYIIEIILLPIDTLISSIFPDFTSLINNFTTFINQTFFNYLSFFFSLLPPIFKGELILVLTFVISYYSIYLFYNSFVLLWKIIHQIKFW